MSFEVTAEMLEALNRDLASPSAHDQILIATPGSGQTACDSVLIPPRSKQDVPETTEEVVKVTSALDALPADALRGNGKIFEPGDTHTTENYWLIVIWAIASLGWEYGKEIARHWSQRSERYSEEGFEAAWNAYDPTRPRAIGIGSLFKLARERGWKHEPHSVDACTTSRRYTVLTADDIRHLSPQKWRVKGLLPASGIAAMYGPPGSAKTFGTLDCAASIAKGEDWFGHKCNQAPVIYVMLEGDGGLRNRIEALEKVKGPLPGCFGAIIEPFEFTKPQDISDLHAVVPSGAVVFIDTLNRAAPTADENSSADMGAILSGAKELQSKIEGLVVIVHHTGKDSSKGLRGHSSLLAALDACIEFERTANQRSWKLTKSKDGVDGVSVAFKLERVVLGVDADGEEVSSCVVQPDGSGVFSKREPQGAQQRITLQRLQGLLRGGQHTNTGRGGAPAGTACMEVEDAITAVASGLTATPQNKRRNEARRLVKGLMTTGHLNSGLDSAGVAWCWL